MTLFESQKRKIIEVSEAEAEEIRKNPKQHLISVNKVIKMKIKTFPYF